MEEKIIYRLDDDISFRKCSLHDEAKTEHGDCTNYEYKEIKYNDYCVCNQEGIHFHCTNHPEIELDYFFQTDETDYTTNYFLKCPKCKKDIPIQSLQSIRSRCQKLLNIEQFKTAKLVRLDDWYVPELKEKIDTKKNYFISANVKTDKDGDTIIVLYVGHKGDKEKVQYFIKPEKMQLTSDHKDLDPAKIISKIEVTLKDRTISHEYDE